MGSSFYLQLAPYLLLEYTYGGTETTFNTNQVGVARITNNYTGELQFLNTSAAENVSQNVLDTSAANLGGFKWAFLDKDVPVPYISQDSNLGYTDLSSVIFGNIEYDRVRIHILSGYRLEDLEGFITQIYVKEAQSRKNSIFANNVYLNSDNREKLNSKPILLGDRMYDRYVEFLIPSLKSANSTFYANPTNQFSLGYQYASDTRGFLFNSSIYVKVYEINRIEKKNGNLFLYTSDTYEINVNQEDTYSLLSATVEEASDGDYFIYYPTFDGNFIEDFIADLNASGGNYIVINDIDVYEQVGLDNLLTYSFSQGQQGEFEQPLEYRPLIKYAESAVAFHIDYTVRIFNRENGYQLIRKASTTSYNPKKYGKNIEKINLTQLSSPIKVYNKVYGSPTVSFNPPSVSTGGFSTVYVPVFFDSKKIVIQTKSVLTPGADPLNAGFGENSIYFGQRDARIYLSDFDSYFKFSVFKLNSPPAKLDLSASKIQMAFKDSLGNMITIPSLDSSESNSATEGELIFKVPGHVRKKILVDEGVKNFYLISTNPGVSDTILYTGTVDIVENVDKEAARLEEISTEAANSSTSTTTSTTTSTETTVSGSAISNNENSKPSILDTLKANNNANINSITKTQEVESVDIPGFTFDPNAVSVKTGVKPVSIDAENVSKKIVSTNLSKEDGAKTILKKKKL